MFKNLTYPFVLKLNDKANQNLYIINNETALAKFAYKLIQSRMIAGYYTSSLTLEAELANYEVISENENATDEINLKLQELQEEIIFQNLILTLLSAFNEEKHELTKNGVNVSIYLLFHKHDCVSHGFSVFPTSEITRHRNNSHVVDLL